MTENLQPTIERHNRTTVLLCLSRLFERTFFYGFRTLFMIYVLENMSESATGSYIELLGWLATAIMISQVIGALIGDLLIHSKTALLIGGALQTLGCLLLCIENDPLFLIGFSSIVLGNGLYGSNLIATFARNYISKRKIIDAGFSIYYTAANIGGFMGTLFIGLIADEFGIIIGLFTTAFCMLTATILAAITPKVVLEQVKQTRPPINNIIAVLAVCFIGLAVFWVFYEFSWFSFLDVQAAAANLHSSDIALFGLDNIGSIITMIVIAIFSVIWSHFYYNQLKKLAVGFLAMAIGLFFASFVGELYTEASTFIILIAMLFIGIAEAHIAPIINSVITRSFNPKYLAIIMSLTFIPTVLFSKIISSIKNEFHIPMSQTQMLLVGIVGLGFFGFLLLLFVKRRILKLDSP